MRAFAAIVLVACSGATDPNPKQAVDGGATSSSSSSGDVATGKPDAGPRTGPTKTPGQIACGASSCATPNVCCSDTGECKPSADACPKEVVSCDELADCAQGKCCAEESTQTPMHFSTYCRPTCITNLPRVQVCVADEECATGVCKDYSCGGFDMKGVKTCAPLGACD
jgi:hypothetical protein